jgi:hypothetical protein
LSSEGTKILVLALSPMPSPLRSPTKTAQTPSRGAIRPFPWKIGDLISDNKVYPFPLQLWVGVFPAMIINLDIIHSGQSAVAAVFPKMPIGLDVQVHTKVLGALMH